MALKGKKKSRSRGSQARRRPAAAPRPTVSAARKTPWYRTTAGIAAGVVAGVIVLVLVAWAVVNARSNARELSQRQDALEDYSGELSVLVQELTNSASTMATAAQLRDGELADQATAWSKQFTDAQAQLATVTAPSGLAPVNSLILQSVVLYGAAAETFELVPKVGERSKQDLLTRASAQWQSANSVFESAVGVLDEERSDAELGAATIRAPGLGQPPSGPSQTTQPSDEVGVGGGGGKDDRKGRGGKKKGRGGKKKGRGSGSGNDRN